MVELHDDQLAYHREQIFVPEDNEIKRNILALHHDSLIAGHLGRDGTIDLIKRQYWCPKMREYITEYVQGCHSFPPNNHPIWQQAGPLDTLPLPNTPYYSSPSYHLTHPPN